MSITQTPSESVAVAVEEARDVGAEIGGAAIAATVQAVRREIEVGLRVRWETGRPVVVPNRRVVRGCDKLDFLPLVVLGRIGAVHYRARLHNYSDRDGEADYQVEVSL